MWDPSAPARTNPDPGLLNCRSDPKNRNASPHLLLHLVRKQSLRVPL